MEPGKLARVLVPMDLLQELTGNTGKVTMVFVKLDDPANVQVSNNTTLNYPAGAPGHGVATVGDLTLVNVIGRAFMASDYEDPFRGVDEALKGIPAEQFVLVDVHAEATSEKQAMGWYLDGRVTAVVGTHTHVPTADTRVLPRGTAYCTDAGMCGARDSVIGDEIEAVLSRFLTQMPTRLPPAKGVAQLNGLLIEADNATKRAVSITRHDVVLGH